MQFHTISLLINRLVPSIAVPKEAMIDTMIGHGIRPTEQDYGQTAQTLSVIAPETEAMCTKALMRNGFGIRKETETIGHLVNDLVNPIDAIIMIEDRQTINLNVSVTGLNMSARLAKNTTTTANPKSLNGRNPATGSIGRRTKSMNVIGNVTDVIEIVIVSESTTDSLTRHLGIVVAVRRKDIPTLVDLVLCRIVTTAAVVVAAMRLLVQQRIEIIIEITSLLRQCRSRCSLEDIAMVWNTLLSNDFKNHF